MAGLSFKVRWRSFGSDKTYNVYYRRNDEASYTKANNLPIVDNADGNVYVIGGSIAPDTIYWVYAIETRSNNDIPNTFIGPKTAVPIINQIKVLTYSG